MTHRHPFNQGSSPLPGPTGAQVAVPQTLPGTPVPITLAISPKYPDGRRAIWGTTMKYVFKLDANKGQMKYFSKFPREQPKADAISGAYSLIDKDGFYFVPTRLTIEAYRDAVPGNPESEIAKSHDFTLPNELVQEGELIVGMNMTFDGRIVFVTNQGLVGSLSRELDDLQSIRLTNEDGSVSEVSNSLAVDDEGRIIVVTDRFVANVQWDVTSPQRLRKAWQVNYKSEDIQRTGRLGTGSGTTPSLMGWGNEDQLVAICDGQQLMNMVLIWRGEIPSDWIGLPGRDRRIAAEVPITFGDEKAKRSTTEQSLTVHGHEIATVSNHYGQLTPIMQRFVRRRMGNDIHNMTVYRSNSPGVAPFGVQKLSWDQNANQLKVDWVRRDLSCPNGIPTMSAATGLMYFIGQRDGLWTLEAVDWGTGEQAFHQTLSNSSDHNSFYAATQVGMDGSVITGAFGGVVKFAKPAQDAMMSRTPAKANATTTQ
jgi:hypothetical protein